MHVCVACVMADWMVHWRLVGRNVPLLYMIILFSFCELNQLHSPVIWDICGHMTNSNIYSRDCDTAPRYGIQFATVYFVYGYLHHGPHSHQPMVGSSIPCALPHAHGLFEGVSKCRFPDGLPMCIKG